MTSSGLPESGAGCRALSIKEGQQDKLGKSSADQKH
jgi:hypothetical protein